MIDCRRIVLVLHDFSGGGSEAVAIRLAGVWAARRTVEIVAGTGVGPARARVAAGIAVHDLGIPRGPGSRRRLGRALAGMVDAHDVVVGPGNFHVPVLAGLHRSAATVACKLSNPIVRPERSRVRQALFVAGLRRATRGFDALVAMSPLLAEEARRQLGRSDVACIAEPLVADGWTAPAPGPTSRTIVCAGRLTAQKDFGLALDAFALLDPDMRLVILGDGEARAALTAHAAALGIAARVEFAGHVPDITPWLARGAALLCSSRYEGYPAVLVEALAAGVPVVTTPCSPAVPEIMSHPSFGRVASSARGLADALAAVIGTRPEPAALTAAMARHRAAQSATAWLAMLDRAFAARNG